MAPSVIRLLGSHRQSSTVGAAAFAPSVCVALTTTDRKYKSDRRRVAQRLEVRRWRAMSTFERTSVPAIIVAVFAAALLFATGADARGSGGHSSGSHSGSHSSGHASSHSSHAATGHTATSKRAAQGVTRDSHGKIARSAKAEDDFKHSHPCPSTGRKSGACPGYVIDHRQALKHGGSDTASNMQWQTAADAKTKDRTE